MTTDATLFEALKEVSTATVTMILFKKGLRNVWMRGPRPMQPGAKRVVGRAFTMRFVPAREDLATPESWSSPYSTRGAVESMPEGCVAVVDAMGISYAGVFGDILCGRMVRRRVTALVTDGAVRDSAGVCGTGLAVWCQGVSASPSILGLTFVGWQQAIGCGGVAVFPDDVIVADSDGVVVIPSVLVEHVADVGPNQERMESWITSQIDKGTSLVGLYPMDPETAARYAAEVPNNDP